MDFKCPSICDILCANPQKTQKGSVMLKFAVALVCTLVFSLSATEKLPKYGTKAWTKLPGASDVIQDAQKGDIFWLLLPKVKERLFS